MLDQLKRLIQIFGIGLLQTFVDRSVKEDAAIGGIAMSITGIILGYFYPDVTMDHLVGTVLVLFLFWLMYVGICSFFRWISLRTLAFLGQPPVGVHQWIMSQ